MLKRERTYALKWGYSFKQILKMPREQFANMHGPRFLTMGFNQFKSVLKAETPIVNRNQEKSQDKFIPSDHVSQDDHHDLQRSFAYDEPCVLL